MNLKPLLLEKLMSSYETVVMRTVGVVIDKVVVSICIGAHSTSPPFNETSDKLFAKLTNDDIPP